MSNQKLLSLVFAVLALCACAQADDDFARKIDEFYNNEGVVIIKLGAVDIHSEINARENDGVMSEYEYGIADDMRQSGLLNILGDIDLRDGKFHGFDTAFASAQRGVVRQIDTTLTPLGERKLSGILDRNYNALTLRLYNIKVTKIDHMKDIQSENSQLKYVLAYATAYPTTEAQSIGGKYLDKEKIYILALFKKRKIDESYEILHILSYSEDAPLHLRELTSAKLESLIEKELQ